MSFADDSSFYGDGTFSTEISRDFSSRLFFWPSGGPAKEAVYKERNRNLVITDSLYIDMYVKFSWNGYDVTDFKMEKPWAGLVLSLPCFINSTIEGLPVLALLTISGTVYQCYYKIERNYAYFCNMKGEPFPPAIVGPYKGVSSIFLRIQYLKDPLQDRR